MAQGALPYQYEIEEGAIGLTALAGLPVYLDLMTVSGMRRSIERHVPARRGGQGWTDAQVLTSLVMLNLAGGDCVDDLRTLEGDEGFCRVLERAELYGLPRRERREIERRWRQETKQAVPSSSAVFRYLECFHVLGEVDSDPCEPDNDFERFGNRGRETGRGGPRCG